MIAGIFIRNYKSFYNFNFIPLIYSENDKVSAFAGANGVGKSSVLEAIDCILNEKDPNEWDCSNGQRRDRMQIYITFLIKKTEANIFDSDDIEDLVQISDAYWEAEFIQATKEDSSPQAFTKWRADLKTKIDHNKYFLLCIGKNSKGETIPYSINTIRSHWGGYAADNHVVANLLNSLKDNYKYIYIPVENKIDQVLDIKAKELHNIMGKKVFEELEKVLTEKSPVNSDNKSIISSFNDVLESFLEEINGYIEPEYKFSSKGGAIRRTVKANDFINILISVFFSTRPLQKDGKSINALSSGQKRVALIDVFTKVVEKLPENQQKLVIAIDEPESSLDNLNRFRQFQRLVNLPRKKDCQVLLTTHWYGAFLYPIKGRLNFLESASQQSSLTESFNLEHIYDERRKFPQSIEMKSYFDLMSSMYSLIRSDKINWIVCEGRTDVNYLKKYIGSRVGELNIMAFNGFGNVRRLYELLNFAVNEKEEILGRVLFVIDTDTENFIYDANVSRSKSIKLVRWHLDRNTDTSRLDHVSSKNARNTVIEDLLESNFTFNALIKYIKNENLKKKLSVNGKINHSDVSINLGFLNKNSLLFNEVNEVKALISSQEFKEFLSKEYHKQNGTPKRIKAFEEVIKFFD